MDLQDSTRQSIRFVKMVGSYCPASIRTSGELDIHRRTNWVDCQGRPNSTSRGAPDLEKAIPPGITSHRTKVHNNQSSITNAKSNVSRSATP